MEFWSYVEAALPESGEPAEARLGVDGDDAFVYEGEFAADDGDDMVRVCECFIVIGDSSDRREVGDLLEER